METEELEHYKALEEFAADTHNLRFVESRENWRKLMDFLHGHDLETTAHNLRFAFLSLCEDGVLDLLPLGHLAPPQSPQPEAPVPTPKAQPTPVVPIKAKTFAMYRNGKAIEGTVRSL